MLMCANFVVILILRIHWCHCLSCKADWAACIDPTVSHRRHPKSDSSQTQICRSGNGSMSSYYNLKIWNKKKIRLTNWNFIEKSCHYHAHSLKTRSLCSLKRQTLLVLVVSFSACGDPQVTHILSDMTSVISQLIFLSVFRFSPRNWLHQEMKYRISFVSNVTSAVLSQEISCVKEFLFVIFSTVCTAVLQY